LSQACSPFYSGYFGDGGLENYLPRLAKVLISASQVAGIIGVSHCFWLWILNFIMGPDIPGTNPVPSSKKWTLY
jgi:hypothetical protein